MGKFALRSRAKRLEFEDEYIPDNTVWHECNEGEDPFEELMIQRENIPFSSHFLGLLGLDYILIHR